MKRGFTLIEVLVALLLAGVILLAFVQAYAQALGASRRLMQSTELLREGHNALALLGSRVREACYVWGPSSTAISLGGTPSTQNTTQANPSSNWPLQNPSRMLALILPPTPDRPARFMAYYPMRRSRYLEVFKGASHRLLPLPNDEERWVLLEYRRNLTNPQGQPLALPEEGCAAMLQDPHFGLSGGAAWLLADSLYPDPAGPFVLEPDRVTLRLGLAAPDATIPPKTLELAVALRR